MCVFILIDVSEFTADSERVDTEDVTQGCVSVCVCSYYQQKRRNVNRKPGCNFSREAGLCLSWPDYTRQDTCSNKSPTLSKEELKSIIKLKILYLRVGISKGSIDPGERKAPHQSVLEVF